MGHLPENPRGLRLEERAPSITTLIVDAVKAVSSGSPGPVYSSDVLTTTTVQVEGSGLQLSRFSGFSSEGPHTIPSKKTSPFAGVAAASQHRIEQLLPEVMQCVLPELLPSLLPAAMVAALPAASAAASDAGGVLSSSALSAMLESALAPALSAILPRAVTSILTVLLKAINSSDHGVPHLALHQYKKPSPSAAHTAPAASMPEPPKPASHAGSDCSPSSNPISAPVATVDAEAPYDQGAAELRLVPFMLLSGDEVAPADSDAPVKPSALEIMDAAVIAPNDAGVAVSSRVASPAGSVSSASSRPSSTRAAVPAAAEEAFEHLTVAASAAVTAPAASPRRPSLAAFTPAAAAGNVSLAQVVGGEIFSRRLSDTNYGSFTSAAPAASSAMPVVGKAHTQGKGAAPAGFQQPYPRGSGGGSGAVGDHHASSNPPSWGQPEDAISSGDDALSTCSGGDMPSPYGELNNLNGSGAINSSANSFLLCGGASGASDGALDTAAAAAAGLYGFNREDLLERLQQQVQSQQIASPFSSSAELLLAAAGSSSGAAGRSALASQLAAAQAAGAQSQAAAALFLQQQQQQQQQQAAVQQQQQQQQLQQLQQLQAFVSGRSVSSLAESISDLTGGSPPSPTLGSAAAAAAAAGLQWRRSSGTNGTFTSAGDLWATDADALGLAALAQQQQQQQQAAAAGLIQQQQAQQQQQLLAAVAAVNAAGRSLRPEIIALGSAGASAGLSLPSSAAAAAALNGQAAAAAQLAAVAAAAAGGSPAAAAMAATDLASYMDAAMRRMLLVSPQVASELARACGAFSGAHTQLHHLCCVISEQLLDVAAMAPEVAAALLRALAAHRARGAQATDVDPRVMGRILQLLRAGPAGRQLCLVSLEQWVDGLSRIHKRRAYLDTILHNYQLTLKRLVQVMGHQVHAVNMSLPRQLLNDLSPRALLLLTAELAPHPLLQPRRWSEEIIWAITAMHAMGIDMLANAAAAANPAAAAEGQTPTSAFQWELRRALLATAEDINAAGGAAMACGQSPPTAAGAAGPLAGITTAAAASGASGSTTPGGAAVPWAAHAALHRHLLMGLRRVQSRFFSERLRKLHGLYGDAVESLLRSSLPQDVLVPEREVIVLVSVLLMLECRMRPDDFDAAFGRDLQRCLAVSSVDEVASRLRCGLVPDSPLRIDPHKSRALSQLLKLGPLPGQAPF